MLLAPPRGVADDVELRLSHSLTSDTGSHGGDPVGWIADELGEQVWAKQREIAEALLDHPYVAVPSCHSSGKSYLASRLAAWWIASHPIGTARVITSAPSQHQVKTILWGEISEAKNRGNLPGHISEGQVPEWKIGGRVIAFGRKPQDLGTPEQAMQAFQGFHAPHVLVILDEACGVPEWLFNAADTLVTGDHDRVLAIGNPDDPASHFYEVCKPSSIWKVIPISALETPRFTGEDIDPSIPLISRRWVELRKRAWGEDSTLYQSKVLGQFPDISDDTLFPPKLIQQALDTTIEAGGPGGYGGDIARYGADETCAYRNEAGRIRLAASARKQDTVATTGMFAALLRPHGADRVPMYVDADGLGAGVYDQLHEQELPVLEWRGGMPANDPERFVDRRAEAFWQMREAMDGDVCELDLDPADVELLGQLAKLKWKLDGRGRIRIESKDDMRKRGVKSPDRADGAAMAYAAPARLASMKDFVAAAAAGRPAGELNLARKDLW